MSIWYHLGRKKSDFGQVYLAVSVLCWSLSGLVELCSIYLFESVSTYSSEGFRSVFSLFNSFFILLALPWFKYIPKKIEGIVKSKYWLVIIGVPLLFSLLATLSKIFLSQEVNLISELDVYYSIFTLAFLAMILWESFSRRGLKLLSYLSLVCIVVTFFAQLFKLSSSTYQMILAAIFKTNLVMLFFALALSWVKEISESIDLDPNKIFLKLYKRKSEKEKLENVAAISGIQNEGFQEIILTPGVYALLLKFAQRKFEANDWLEIKPKNDDRSNKIYDIKDYNEIKRIVVSVLDGVFGKSTWTKEKHELPLKNALFETSNKRNRNIRLLIPQGNISFEK